MRSFPTPHSRSLKPAPFRRNEQRGVYANVNPNTLDHDQSARLITERHRASQAGLPDPEKINPDYRGLGNTLLPIDAQRHKITKMVRDNKVSMLEGATGSGKTSQLWQYLLGEGYDLTVVIVPRIVIAENVYDRARDELSSQRSEALADKTLGIMTSEHVVRDHTTKVIFMTAGTFTKIFADLEEKYADKPIAIISDEIHEADLQVELATAIAARSMQHHDSWRLVLSSATHDKAKAQAAMSPVNGGEVPIVSVEGRPNNITFIEEPELTSAQALVKYARLAMETDGEEAPWTGETREKSMVFVPGKREAKEAVEAIRKTLGTPEGKQSGLGQGFNPMLLHSKVTRTAMEQVMAPARPGDYDVVASTSAGQSGITIPGLSLVITDGRTKRPELDGEGTEGLFIRDASKAEITQQGGRAGRDVPDGICVVTRAEDPVGNSYFIPISERDEHAPPQILQTNIMRIVLATMALGQDYIDVNPYMMNSVDEQTILEALEGLYRLGAIDRNNNVTDLGYDMDRFPLRPELSRGVVEAWKGGYSLQTIANVTAIASALNSGGFASFEDGSGDSWKSLLRESTEDDIVAQLDMFQATRDAFFGQSVNEELLISQDIDPKNAYKAHRQWDKCLRAMELAPNDIPLVAPSKDDEVEIRDILLAGMVDYVYEQTGVTGRDNDPIYQSIHKRHKDTPRMISSRSLLDGESPHYVVGFPRRYPIVVKERVGKGSHEKGEPKFAKYQDIKHVVEQTWPLSEVSRRKLAGYASHLVQSEILRTEVSPDGRLEEVKRRRLGSIVLSSTQERVVTPTTREGQALLVDATLEAHASDVQRTLNNFIHELGELRNRVSPNEIETYFSRTDFPNKGSLRTWAESAAKHAHSIGEVNENLRTRLYLDDALSMATWISNEAKERIYQKSPSQVTGLNGRMFTLNYVDGQPYIAHMKLSQVHELPASCELLDGREILFRIDSTDKRDRQLYNLRDLQTMRGDFEDSQSISVKSVPLARRR